MLTSFVWSKYALDYQTESVDSTVISVSYNNIFSLLHCSINDMLINRISHCQNMFTKLISVLDLTSFVLKFTSDSMWQKVIIIIITMVTSYMQITFASFWEYSGYSLQCGWQSYKELQYYNHLFPTFSGFYIPKMVYYWLRLKIKPTWHTFFRNTVYIMA